MSPMHEKKALFPGRFIQRLFRPAPRRGILTPHQVVPGQRIGGVGMGILRVRNFTQKHIRRIGILDQTGIQIRQIRVVR